MNVLAALLLQSDKLGKSTGAPAVGAESHFSRILIVLFLIGLVLAAVCAIGMVVRGAAGAAKAKAKGKEKVNEN